MGKGILIVVLGVSIIISILIVNLNANTSQSLDTTIDYFNTTQARLIADSGIETYLEKLRRNKNLTGTFNDNSLMGGTYDIKISGPDSALTIKSVGKFNGKTHICIVTAKREKITIPTITSALYASAPNLGLKLNGNMLIDGTDHNTDGSLGTASPLPGISVDNSSDSTYIIDNIKPKISYAIQGQGGSPSVRTTTIKNDWQKLTENYIFAADTTLATGTYTTGTVLGTASNPMITYANGDVDFSGISYGYGILVVNGDITMEGNFTFYGIVIVYGQSSIYTKTTGNAGVYGSTILVGNSLDMTASGNAQFLYSNQAITNTKNLIKSSRFKILTWWE